MEARIAAAGHTAEEGRVAGVLRRCPIGSRIAVVFIHSRAVPTVFVPIHLLIQILITENAVTAEQFRRGRQEQALKTTNFLAVDGMLALGINDSLAQFIG